MVESKKFFFLLMLLPDRFNLPKYSKNSELSKNSLHSSSSCSKGHIFHIFQAYVESHTRQKISNYSPMNLRDNRFFVLWRYLGFLGLLCDGLVSVIEVIILGLPVCALRTYLQILFAGVKRDITTNRRWWWIERDFFRGDFDKAV